MMLPVAMFGVAVGAAVGVVGIGNEFGNCPPGIEEPPPVLEQAFTQQASAKPISASRKCITRTLDREPAES